MPHWRLRHGLGRLWVGTADGVTRLDPARLPGNEVPPRLALERLEIDGAAWPGPVPFAASGLPAAAEQRLGPSISDLRFDFAALSFTAPERVRYRFMLAGWDDDLGAPTDERHVTYRHLPPGRYRFVTTACNNDGVWTSPPLELPLVVLPAWYQTWWFRAAVLLTVCGFVVGGFAVHTVGQRRRRAALEREVDLADRLLYLTKQRGRDRACGLAWGVATAGSVSDAELVRWAHADPAAPLPGLEAVEIRRRS